MNLPALLILTFAAGFIAGLVASLFVWIAPLRVERERWKKAAYDCERMRAWEHGYTSDGYRRRAADRSMWYAASESEN